MVDTASDNVTGNGIYSTSQGYALPSGGGASTSYQWQISYSGGADNLAASTSVNLGQVNQAINFNSITPVTYAPNKTVTHAGSIVVDAIESGGGIYLPASTVSQKLVFNQADAKFTLNPFQVLYDGNAHTGTVTAAGVNGEDLSADLSIPNASHTNAGNFNDSWSFSDPNGRCSRRSSTTRRSPTTARPRRH